jgi:type III restriction enzyme
MRPEGSSADVSYWTSKEVRDTLKSHVNYVVIDSQLEARAAQKLDGTKYVSAWVKNAGLGLGIPYVHNGEKHDYIPDFIVRLADDSAERYLLLETKGHDEMVEVKKAAAERWCAAVTADGKYGAWTYRLAYKESDVGEILRDLLEPQVA